MTCAFALLDALHSLSDGSGMLNYDRDRRVIQLVGRFGQVSSDQVSRLLFHDRSPSVYKRVLKRLADTQMLVRVERRVVGGAHGGSGQYVYQVGPKGWSLTDRSGRYWKYRAISYHALGVAECFTKLIEAERAGLLGVAEFVTEPDCWRTVGGVLLKPDFYVVINTPRGQRLQWVEVDLGSERAKVIQNKCERYWKAYVSEEASKWEYFPHVVFVVPDEDRRIELARLLSRLPVERQPLFSVMLEVDYPQV